MISDRCPIDFQHISNRFSIILRSLYRWLKTTENIKMMFQIKIDLVKQDWVDWVV